MKDDHDELLGHHFWGFFAIKLEVSNQGELSSLFASFNLNNKAVISHIQGPFCSQSIFIFFLVLLTSCPIVCVDKLEELLEETEKGTPNLGQCLYELFLFCFCDYEKRITTNWSFYLLRYEDEE